ncbi:potassium channel protein [Methanofollis aquaemaris]|uniref:Potassium channel protein n=1 Tax=Methanofollis aquaemaris TaxID=126734 RepID=A0A8A3S389_9EURY|nr:TrkA C-terminal domain-containing protein [Methanofollis aquaemaris]QSZ66074.1 potassium channel protein [Methanofollis aquaemaris]
MMEVEYQPTSLKDVLIEMKDISELMVDLAYSAILFESRDIAGEVGNLEEIMNRHVYQARISAMLGARRVEEAESMSGLLQIAESAERISNSASEVAKLILKGAKFPQKLRDALPAAEEVTVRVEVQQESALAGQTLGEVKLQSRSGMRVIAIRRGNGWIYDPDKYSQVAAGDILLAKGLEAGIPPFHIMAGVVQEAKREAAKAGYVDDLDRAVALMIEMKNLSELAVGLAYTSLLFTNEDVAQEVVALDERMEDMRYQFDLWVLEASKRIENVEYLRGLLYLSSFAETISDAASAIAEVLLRDIEIPPVFRLIVRESDEIITHLKVKNGSALAGRSLKEASLATVTGMVVLAVKRGGERWKYRPGRDERLHAGDSIIAKGRRDGEERLASLCSGENT